MKPQASPVLRPRRAPELSTALCSCQALLEAVIFMALRGMHCTLIHLITGLHCMHRTVGRSLCPCRMQIVAR